MPVNNDAASRHRTNKSMAPYNVVPVADPWTKPYWDGAAEHRLMIQRCQGCGNYNHPPVFICMKCNDRDATLAFEQVSGRGTVYSWFIAYHAQVGGFERRPLIWWLRWSWRSSRGCSSSAISWTAPTARWRWACRWRLSGRGLTARSPSPNSDRRGYRLCPSSGPRGSGRSS